MARILHLEADESFRKKISDALKISGHEVVSVCDATDAEKNRDAFDLYIISEITYDPYFSGLLFALHVTEKGGKVLLMSEKKKFSKFPFIPISAIGKLPSVVDDLLLLQTM